MLTRARARTRACACPSAPRPRPLVIAALSYFFALFYCRTAAAHAPAPVNKTAPVLVATPVPSPAHVVASAPPLPPHGVKRYVPAPSLPPLRPHTRSPCARRLTCAALRCAARGLLPRRHRRWVPALALLSAVWWVELPVPWSLVPLEVLSPLDYGPSVVTLRAV